MENEYGYANARLRAMKSRLLNRAALAELVNTPTVEDVVAYLTHTPYQQAVEEALVRLSGWECLSEALRHHVAETLSRITRFFSGNPQRLWKILIARWQVFNIKTILRGVANNVPADEILDALVPVGDLQESDFRRLAQQTSVRAVVDLLATWNHPLARQLLAAFPRYAETGNLAQLELALDRARYAAAFKELDELDDSEAEKLRALLEHEVDATNILILLRLCAASLSSARLVRDYGSASAEAFLIKGGGPTTARLFAYKDLPTLEQLVRDLQNSPLGGALARGQARYAEKQSVSAFEDEIETQLMQQRVALFHKDPLSIGIAVAYLAALVAEVRNLRLVGRAKAARWKREDIEKEIRQWQS